MTRKFRRFVARVITRVVLPFVPKKWKLPFCWQLSLLREEYEPELLLLEKWIGRVGVAVDVGANIGYYSYRLSKLSTQVWAFEINAAITSDLRAFNAPNVRIEEFGLSSEAGVVKMYIPELNGMVLSGWGSIDRDNCQDATLVREEEVRVKTLDSYQFNKLDFLKIDVEGHEVEVLNGGIQTLRRCRPRILVEVKDKNLSQIRTFFSALGYTEARLKEIIGVEGSRENFIFLPV